jgi:hypothetical protein
MSAARTSDTADHDHDKTGDQRRTSYVPGTLEVAQQ